MKKLIHWIAVVILLFALILIRGFEEDLFYDPFLAFFHTTFRNTSFPIYDLKCIIANISFRYWLNTFCSLGILYFMFGSKKIVTFATITYLILFVSLLPIYIFLIEKEFKPSFIASFYTRRFLIQPMFLLILIPAFYYQKMKTK